MKKIFHEYGGVIITVIAIVALIGLVTLLMQPGGLMEGAFGNISQSFVDKSNSLIADAGVSNGGNGGSTPDSTSVIPEGGTYTTASGEVFAAGANFPATVSNGDTYAYGDYLYTYNVGSDTYVDGWHVGINTAVTNKNQTTYGAILGSINGAPVTDMRATFCECASLTTAPVIPDGVTNLFCTFDMCYSLNTYAGSTAPAGDFSGYVLPSGVTNMRSTFGMTQISIPPVIPPNVTDMTSTFYRSSLNTLPEIPTGVTTLAYAFNDCPRLSGDISDFVIPETVTDISGIFRYSGIAKAPAIPTSVTQLEGAFDGCSSLSGTIEIPCTCEGQEIGYSDVTLKHVEGCDH